MSGSSEVLVGIVGTVLCFGAVLYGVSRINYRIGDHYLRMRIGPIPLRKIAIEDICDVQLGYRHWSENWTNTIYMPTIRKKAVTLFRRSGGLRTVNLTPEDPAAFVELIRAHPRFTPDRPGVSDGRPVE
jgi:hypothetical protein